MTRAAADQGAPTMTPRPTNPGAPMMTAPKDACRQGQAYAHPAHLLPQRRADAILHHATASLRAAEAVREEAYEAVHQAVRALGLEDDRAPVHRAQAVAHATEEAVNVARTASVVALWAIGDSGPHYAVEGPIEGVTKGGADADALDARARDLRAQARAADARAWADDAFARDLRAAARAAEADAHVLRADAASASAAASSAPTK